MISAGSVINAMGSVAGWMSRNPMAMQTGLGAAAGYIGSGGSGWGALAGGGMGLASGTQGWNSKSKGVSRLTKGIAGKLGISRTVASPSLGQASSNFGNKVGLRMNLNNPMLKAGGGNAFMGSKFPGGGALSSNPAYKTLSYGIQGANVAMKAGAIGLGIGMARGAVSYVGSNFGNNTRAPYGSTFSGMGNGTGGMM